jgi:hypothetical protein
MAEIWENIDVSEKYYKYDNYAVSNLGRIKNTNTGRLMKTYIHPMGYEKITLNKNGIPQLISVHQLVASVFIENPNRFTEVDHMDHNPSNNNVSNLRWVSHSQNCGNRRKQTGKAYTSVYKGVCFDKRTQKWITTIKVNYKLTYIGLYDDEHDAGRAYNERAKEIFGEHAYLNKIDN